ncbi:unnamed protein product [Prunus armeniaca]|uniref:Uncharacterized protein n=1 Tax=Prunus armeniaca TaxID=36596 RepID=A0A6J5V6L4_PRUAR|nr:unnamed protein product [Prunus armeniaca]CAB4315102.1 unnamed protein product [Prunus armeniaca]
MSTSSSSLQTSVSPMLKQAAVVWPSFLTTYLMTIIATYLTRVWEISITNAAAIVNIYWGVVGILPLALKLIVDAFIGSYWMIFMSKVAFITIA